MQLYSGMQRNIVAIALLSTPEPFSLPPLLTTGALFHVNHNQSPFSILTRALFHIHQSPFPHPVSTTGVSSLGCSEYLFIQRKVFKILGAHVKRTRFGVQHYLEIGKIWAPHFGIVSFITFLFLLSLLLKHWDWNPPAPCVFTPAPVPFLEMPGF